MIAATDPGLSVVARLGAPGDVADTREWVAAVLGDLASDDENDARLRETLRVFLGCGSSYKVAAEELNLHFNSVKYRVGRAVARRGREIGLTSGATGSTSNSRCSPVTGTAPRFWPLRPARDSRLCSRGDGATPRCPTPDGVAGGDDRRNEHRKGGEGDHGGDGQDGSDEGSHGQLTFLRCAELLE